MLMDPLGEQRRKREREAELSPSDESDDESRQNPVREAEHSSFDESDAESSDSAGVEREQTLRLHEVPFATDSEDSEAFGYSSGSDSGGALNEWRNDPRLSYEILGGSYPYGLVDTNSEGSDASDV